MQTWIRAFLQSNWTWAPSVLVGLVLWTAAYALVTGPLRRRYAWGPPVPVMRQVSFYLGVLAMFLALCSPLDELGDEALFSAHMLQHMLLIFVTPPLWLMGTPAWLVERIFPAGKARRILAMIISPLSGLLVFNGILWLWHVPSLYQLALTSEGIHIVEHLMFVGAALIGWAPVLLDAPLNPLPAPGRALYLFFTSLPMTGMAALLTLSNRLIYPFYAGKTNAFQITALVDQQLGGLLMWVPGGMLFFVVIMLILARWLSGDEKRPLAHAPDK